jgi:hypothetical protein
MQGSIGKRIDEWNHLVALFGYTVDIDAKIYYCYIYEIYLNFIDI